MAARPFAQTFAKRLPGIATAHDLARMAQSPSYRAPRACDVLHPPAFVPPSAPVLSADEQTVLNAVLAMPNDDVPRLVYADWCERVGNHRRAAFIRDQLAGTKVAPDPVWAAMFEPWCARHIVYRRGFVEAMSLAGRAFITLGEPLFRMTPLRQVHLVAIAPYLNELATYPHLKRLQVLDLRGNRIMIDDCKAIRHDSLTILCDGN